MFTFPKQPFTINRNECSRSSETRKQEIEGRPTTRSRLQNEREHLQGLPAEAFDPRQKKIASVSSRSLVRIDGAEYSVPEEWAGLRASVLALTSPTTVTFVWREKEVGHDRQRPGGRSVDYRHYLGELSRKPQALRQVAPTLVSQLGEPFPRLWERLVAEHGELAAARVLADVLAVVRSEGHGPVCAAVEIALACGRLDLSALILQRPASRVTVPSALSTFEVEVGSAKVYDELLGSRWVQ